MKRTIAMACVVASGFFLWQPLVEAQQARAVPRIGYVSFGAPGSDPTGIQGLRQGLNGLGYVENKTIRIEYRYAEGKPERLPGLISDLTKLKVDVLVTQGTAVTTAAKEATSTVPIVSVTLDPVGSGLVQSLARPGGNVTGLSFAHGENFSGKWLGFLKDTVPQAKRVGVLWNPSNQAGSSDVKELETLSTTLGFRLTVHPVRSPEDISAAFAEMKALGTDALIVETDPFVLAQRVHIVNLAAMYRLPTIYGLRDFVSGGGLMSYGADLSDLWIRAALYVDRVLKGTNPADLPVAQSSKFELVINAKTAKALGLTIPQSVLMRADEVIR
jgi:putative ABC transport system substrate-binding protein